MTQSKNQPGAADLANGRQKRSLRHHGQALGC